VSSQPEGVRAGDEQRRENDFTHLPPPVRREDLRTSHDVVAHPDLVGENDRERDWLLRTAGIFW
jgi:hypothetical protein